jgi:hypothetical protein
LEVLERYAGILGQVSALRSSGMTCLDVLSQDHSLVRRVLLRSESISFAGDCSYSKPYESSSACILKSRWMSRHTIQSSSPDLL